MDSPVAVRAYTGRLAPSPTGALHLGNVRTFMVAWLRARSLGGRILLRIEDLDHPRDKPGAADGAVQDLRWLGFDWDDECVQSQRRPLYREALASLVAEGLAYPCVCTRRDVEAAQSAPHDGEQLFYPGTCRDRFRTWQEAADAADGRTPCWRFRTPPNTLVSFDDAFAGTFSQEVSRTLGDFPLARDVDGAGYTLACALDDLETDVTEVVRGGDLLAATPAQILVARALLRHVGRKSEDLPGYCHVPLCVGPDGKRLAKRHGDARIASFRAAGVAPGRILGLLAASCGWAEPGEEISLEALVPRFTLASIPKEPFVITDPSLHNTHYARKDGRSKRASGS